MDLYLPDVRFFHDVTWGGAVPWRRLTANAALTPGERHGLPLGGMSVLIIEDEALIALSVESCLLDAGAARCQNSQFDSGGTERS